MSTQKNEHNPDGLPEMEKFRFLCIGETFQKGDEFWNRQTKQWEESWNYLSPETTPVEQSDWTYRRRITPPTDTTGSGREGETPETDAFEPKHQISIHHWADFARQLERQRDAALAQVEALRRDEERLDWVMEFITENGTDALANLPWTNLADTDPMAEDELVFDRAAIDSAQRQEGA